ncbi:MAG TPA: DUF4282 domain-containing protein [Acidobacteriota bacterium]|jgi:hypothetical protein|nr:DUF4282 domain-containing protein [Acidobacteriota bacterium]
MAESRWMITIDGKQQDGDYSVEETREILKKNAGKHLLVWSVGMAQWAEPSNVPEFRKMPAKVAEPEKEIRPKISSQEIKEKAGLFKGLLDFGFQNFVTTKIIPLTYIVALVLIVLGGLFYFVTVGIIPIIAGIRLRSFLMIFTGLAVMIGIPIVMLIYIMLIRIWSESVLVFFKMKDDLAQIASKSTTVSEKK